MLQCAVSNNTFGQHAERAERGQYMAYVISLHTIAFVVQWFMRDVVCVPSRAFESLW